MLKNRTKSFTLIELIAVIAIISISGLIVAPRLADFINSWAVDVEAKTFGNWVRYVRSQTIATGGSGRYEVSIQRYASDSGFYKVQHLDLSANRWVEDKSVVIRKGVHISDMKVGNSSQPSYTIKFDSSGSIPSSIKVYFTAQAGGALKQKIVNISITGRVFIAGQ